MERNFIEKRMQRMSSKREIDNLSVWCSNNVCVPEYAILDDDLLTRPEYDLHNIYRLTDAIVALSSRDATIKYRDKPTKRYKFDYILGTAPEDCLSAYNQHDTVVQICSGDSLARIIKIDDEGEVSISYKSIPEEISGLVYYDYVSYKFIICLRGTFYIGFKSTTNVSGKQIPIVYTTDFETFTPVSGNCSAGVIKYFYATTNCQAKVDYTITNKDSTQYYSAITSDNDSYSLIVSRLNNDKTPESLTLYATIYSLDALGCCDSYYNFQDGYFIFLSGKKLIAAESPSAIRVISSDITTLIGDIDNNDVFIFYGLNISTTSRQAVAIAKHEKSSSIIKIYDIKNIYDGGSPSVRRTKSLKVKGTDFKFMQNLLTHHSSYIPTSWNYKVYNDHYTADRNVALYCPAIKEVIYLHFVFNLDDFTNWLEGYGGIVNQNTSNNYLDITQYINKASSDDKRVIGSYTGTGTVNKSTGYASMTIKRPSTATSCDQWSIMYINAENGDHCILFPSSGWGFSMYGNKYSNVLFSTSDGTMTVSYDSITIKCKNGKASSNFDNQASSVMNTKNIDYSWQAES